ncbi:MAG: hypothetical protein KQJ78_24265 [Deltaproteobacteria bacterium]|nr:hypothetical protein [Deltaproteobacteria bacterium]
MSKYTEETAIPKTAQPEDANPRNLPGERNLQCPYYVYCLDIAAANMWPQFTCELCFYRKTKKDTKIEELDLCAPGWEDIWGGSG